MFFIFEPGQNRLNHSNKCLPSSCQQLTCKCCQDKRGAEELWDPPSSPHTAASRWNGGPGMRNVRGRGKLPCERNHWTHSVIQTPPTWSSTVRQGTPTSGEWRGGASTPDVCPNMPRDTGKEERLVPSEIKSPRPWMLLGCQATCYKAL